MNDRTDATDQTLTGTQRVPVERADVPLSEAAPPNAAATADTGNAATRDDVGLLPSDALGDFRSRWDRIQVGFVDEPRQAVQQAHDLVDELVDRLTQSFSQQRSGLEGAWSRGDQVSTDDLRLALQRYRSFFNRLLST